MTLSTRNVFLKLGIALAAVMLLLFTVAAFVSLSFVPKTAAAAVHRSSGLFQFLAGGLVPSSPYGPVWAMAASVLYALIAAILIYYFFEKTQSPEVLFFALFTISFAFESMRIMTPLALRFEIPSLYVQLCARLLLFGRYLGLFCLFTSSIFAAGLKPQQQQGGLLLVTAAALVITIGSPVDSLAWSSEFMMITGYAGMFGIVQAGVFFITLTSFILSAWSRGEKEFLAIGAGSALVFLGRDMLTNCDAGIWAVPGSILLGLGTWLICVKLHKVYLWL